jgi:glycosyltransferase involved in cell wall biosynthesis
MLSWEFPPRIIGGISTHVYELSRALARIGIETHVVTCDFPEVPDQEIVDGVHVSRVDCSSISEKNFMLWTFYMNSRMIERGNEILKEYSYDLIHAHDWMVGRAAAELKSQHGLPLVSTIHATELGRGGSLQNDYQKTVHYLEETLMSHSDKLICTSNYMFQHLSVNFNPRTNIEVIPNAVDVKSFKLPKKLDKITANLGLPTDIFSGKVILYLGRLVQEKGLYTLIDAFERIRKNTRNLNLVIAGEGPIKDRLIRKVQDRGLEKSVHFTGFVDEETKVALYRLCHLFVLPSHYEPFGIVVLEAMSSRIPVVVSDVGGLSEIVEDNVTGLKVPPGDPKSLANAMKKTLETPQLADMLAENAFVHVSARYTWNSVAERTAAVYHTTMMNSRFSACHDEEFLTDIALVSLLFTLGITKKEASKTAREIASSIGATKSSVKSVLDGLISQGYVKASFDPTSSNGKVRYYLTKKGVISSCSLFS